MFTERSLILLSLLQVESERERGIKLEESNRCLVQQLQNYIEQNCSLTKEKAAVEENNYKIITEVRLFLRPFLIKSI